MNEVQHRGKLEMLSFALIISGLGAALGWNSAVMIGALVSYFIGLLLVRRVT